jgi:hypothetical protein
MTIRSPCKTWAQSAATNHMCTFHNLLMRKYPEISLLTLCCPPPPLSDLPPITQQKGKVMCMYCFFNVFTERLQMHQTTPLHEQLPMPPSSPHLRDVKGAENKRGDPQGAPSTPPTTSPLTTTTPTDRPQPATSQWPTATGPAQPHNDATATT